MTYLLDKTSRNISRKKEKNIEHCCVFEIKERNTTTTRVTASTAYQPPNKNFLRSSGVILSFEYQNQDHSASWCPKQL